MTELLNTLTGPRITEEYMASRVRSKNFITPEFAPTLTICVITLDNGFHSVGMSAPAAGQNYNMLDGETYAEANAMRKLWPHFGFALSEKIHAVKHGEALAGVDVSAENDVPEAPAGDATTKPAVSKTPPVVLAKPKKK